MRLLSRIALSLAATLLSVVGSTSAAADLSADPAQIKIVTSDVTNFWHAYDEAQKSRNLEKALAFDYFAPGTKGVWGFVPDRIVSPSYLAGTVRKYRDYYIAARPYMNQISREKPRILADLQRYKLLYPKAVFPDLYFVVGSLNSGGTSVAHVGLIIGSEMVSRPPQMRISMPGFDQSVLNTNDSIPGLVAHEFTHFNQRDAERDTLLDATIYEGTADFMAEMVDPNKTVQDQWRFGCLHEDQLWREFAQEMNSSDEKVANNWLFSYHQGPLGAPPFIGYWVGSRIVQTYYVNHGKSNRALDDIMHVQNFKSFLTESGYPAKRPQCVAPAPETR